MPIQHVVRGLIARVVVLLPIEKTLRILSRAPWASKFVSRMPIRRCFSLTLPDQKSFKYNALPDDGLGRMLFWNGLDYESETLFIFYQLAKRAKTVIDIGAHTGLYTLVACVAQTDSKVIAFEPVPDIYERLSGNVRINGWDGRCALHRCAVSNTTSRMIIHVPRQRALPLTATIECHRSYEGEELTGPGIETDVTTIDRMCEDLDVDLIKIDVEGSEAKALEGMTQLLAQSKPILLIECLPSGPLSQIQAILAKNGYSFYHLRREGAVLTRDIVGDFTFRNYLFFPLTARGKLSEWLDN